MKKMIKKVLLGIGLLLFSANSYAGNLMEEINKQDDLSLFKAIIKYGGAIPVFMTTPETPKYGPFLPFMVFAPNDDALKKTIYNSVDAIKAMAVADGYKEDNPKSHSEKLRNLVKQHVCMKTSDKKADFKPKYDRFEGKKLEVTDGKIKASSNTASVVTADIEATNGMLHIVNAVLD